MVSSTMNSTENLKFNKKMGGIGIDGFDKEFNKFNNNECRGLRNCIYEIKVNINEVFSDIFGQIPIIKKIIPLLILSGIIFYTYNYSYNPEKTNVEDRFMNLSDLLTMVGSIFISGYVLNYYIFESTDILCYQSLVFMIIQSINFYIDKNIAKYYNKYTINYNVKSFTYSNMLKIMNILCFIAYFKYIINEKINIDKFVSISTLSMLLSYISKTINNSFGDSSNNASNRYFWFCDFNFYSSQKKIQ